MICEHAKIPFAFCCFCAELSSHLKQDHKILRMKMFLKHEICEICVISFQLTYIKLCAKKSLDWDVKHNEVRVKLLSLSCHHYLLRCHDKTRRKHQRMVKQQSKSFKIHQTFSWISLKVHCVLKYARKLLLNAKAFCEEFTTQKAFVI